MDFNISQPTLQSCLTDQLLFPSSSSRPFYATRQRDWSARGNPTLVGVDSIHDKCQGTP